MKILIIVGSASLNSHSLHLGRAIGESLNKLSAETEIIELAEYKLPLFDRAIDRSKEYDQKTKSFLDKTTKADAFVWVTPVYHNSFSSTIKNALDWQHFGLDGKVVGIASNGGNRAPVAIDQLMIVARSQHLITSTSRVCTSEEDYDEEFNITSTEIIERIETFAGELVMLANKIGSSI